MDQATPKPLIDHLLAAGWSNLTPEEKAQARALQKRKPEPQAVAGGNRYKPYDKGDVRVIFDKLRKPDSDRDALRERLADYDPLDLLTRGSVMAGALATAEQKELVALRLERASMVREVTAVRVRLSARESRDAFERDILQHSEKIRRRFPWRHCAACFKKFVPGRADANTCSPKCRTALYRKRKREKEFTCIDCGNPFRTAVKSAKRCPGCAQQVRIKAKAKTYA